MDFATTIRAYGTAAAFGTSLLFLVLSSLLQPQFSDDGLCAVLAVSPLGWVAGSLAGAGVALSSKKTIKPRHPFMVSFEIIIAGMFLLFIPPIISLFAFVLPNARL